MYFQLLSIMMFIHTSSCIYNQNLLSNKDKLIYTWNNHQQLISKIFYYQIQGNIVYTIDSKNKTYIRFLFTHSDDNHYNIKLFNIFGLTIISISVEHEIIYIKSSLIYQNYDLKNQIQRWLININFFKEHLQKWIIGLPGDNTKYNLNAIGYLSDIHYCYNGENISIFYRLYYTNNIPVLPAILEIYYSQYSIKLNINRWSL